MGAGDAIYISACADLWHCVYLLKEKSPFVNAVRDPGGVSMPYDVFISYSNHDKPTADAICARLEQDGVRCWYAPRDIRPGEIWAESIIKTIETVKVMVVVFTADSNKSPQVLKEITNAVSAGVTIVPFKLTDQQPSKSLQYFFADVHWLDAVGAPLNKSIESLSQKVRAIVREESTPPATPPPEPPKKNRLPLILGAAVLVVLLVGLGLLLGGKLGGGKSAPTALPQTVETTPTVAPIRETAAPATDAPAASTAIPTAAPTAEPTKAPTAEPTDTPVSGFAPLPTRPPVGEPTAAPTVNPNNADYFWKPTGVAYISDGKQLFVAPISSLYTITSAEITHGMRFMHDTGSDLPTFDKIASMQMGQFEGDNNEYHRFFHVTLRDGSVMEEDVQTARSILIFMTDSGRVLRKWHQIDSIQFDHSGACMVDWPEYARLTLRDGSTIIVPAFTLNPAIKARPSENTIGYTLMYEWPATIKTQRGYEIDFSEIRSLVFGEGSFRTDHLSDIWAEGLKPGWITELPVELIFRDGRTLSTGIAEDFLKFYALDEFGKVEVQADQIARIDFVTDITE